MCASRCSWREAGSCSSSAARPRRSRPAGPRSPHQQFLECVALARQHGFGRLEVANLPMVGWTAMHLAEIGAAVAFGHEAIALAQRASQARAEMTGRALVAWAAGLLRDHRDE